MKTPFLRVVPDDPRQWLQRKSAHGWCGVLTCERVQKTGRAFCDSHAALFDECEHDALKFAARLEAEENSL